MAALSVDRDYIKYMIGHTISTYHDIKMKGVEFLPGIYIASGLSIKPKTRVSKIDALKEIIRALGNEPRRNPNQASLNRTTQNHNRFRKQPTRDSKQSFQRHHTPRSGDTNSLLRWRVRRELNPGPSGFFVFKSPMLWTLWHCPY